MARTDFQTAENPPFLVDQPAQQRVPFVFNSPHSGRCYPRSLIDNSPLGGLAIRRSEDVLVDVLFDSATRTGAPLLKARFPRAWLDVNREPYELDPKLFGSRLPNHANHRSIRVVGGLGTIPRLVAENMPIYSQPPSLEEALDRVELVYRPYHERLRRLMAETVAGFGHAVLVDCHSMPSLVDRKNGKAGQRPDIIIGDRYGTSCHGDIAQALVDGFQALGYHVGRNKPYAGGFITEHYGRPLKGLHAVQIEINRALYMDESTLQPHDGFFDLQNHIASVVERLVSIPDGHFGVMAQAAE